MPVCASRILLQGLIASAISLGFGLKSPTCASDQISTNPKPSSSSHISSSNGKSLPASEQKAAHFLPGMEALHNLSYVPKSADSAHMLDLYFPSKEARADKPLCLIVWIHGGGWKSGSKDLKPFLPLVQNGFAVASINYRLAPETQFPGQIYDCKAAIRWLRAHAREYGIDPGKIGVWGSSAGGHLVALLGTTNGVKSLEGDHGNLQYSSDVQAVCDWFGPSDLPVLIEQSQVFRIAPDPILRRLVTSFLGEENLEKAKAASPITYVTSKAPPFLIFHGDKDSLVPCEQSEELQAALKKAGVKATLQVIKGAGHDGPAFSPFIGTTMTAFFKKYLN
jgi:acetyl esterase/lipase